MHYKKKTSEIFIKHFPYDISSVVSTIFFISSLFTNYIQIICSQAILTTSVSVCLMSSFVIVIVSSSRAEKKVVWNPVISVDPF